MKVYHGSTQAVEYPLVGVGRENLDFGKGFYVTDITKEVALGRLRFEQTNNQLCILNQRLIDECLSFKEYITIK